MKHHEIQFLPSDTPVEALTASEIEARVFEALEAKQRAQAAAQAGAVVVLRYPEDRAWFQRVRAWWHLRYRPVPHVQAEVGAGREPEWQGHWASVKYL